MGFWQVLSFLILLKYFNSLQHQALAFLQYTSSLSVSPSAMSVEHWYQVHVMIITEQIMKYRGYEVRERRFRGAGVKKTLGTNVLSVKYLLKNPQLLIGVLIISLKYLEFQYFKYRTA